VLPIVGRRALHALPLLLIISLVLFGLLHLAPGGPLSTYLENPNVRPEDIERLRKAMGLDRPLGVQYLAWLAAFVRGDWGYSYADGRPVFDRVMERIPATLELIGAACALALTIAIPVAVVAASAKLLCARATLTPQTFAPRARQRASFRCRSDPFDEIIGLHAPQGAVPLRNQSLIP